MTLKSVMARFWLLEKMQGVRYLLDRFKFYVHTWLGLRIDKPVVIHAYKGYGRADHVCLSGRVLLDKFIVSRKEDRAWHNFVNSLKRFRSNEVMGARLRVSLGDNDFVLTTDQEGYFLLDTDLAHPLSLQPDTRTVHAQLLLTHTPWQKVAVTAQASILMPVQAEFGVISDIDDTILRTEVTSLLKIRMLYYTILKNATGREVFDAAGAFFKALARGRKGKKAINPFFYVSNSPWNLYDLLDEFLSLNNLPAGPILLRDFGIPYHKRPRDHKGHKYLQISKILSIYPQLPFVLIGDSGEKDTDIYLDIARDFPGRILVIYIHDVRSQRRAKRVSALMHTAAHVDIRLVSSYEEAAADAVARGLVLDV